MLSVISGAILIWRKHYDTYTKIFLDISHRQTKTEKLGLAIRGALPHVLPMVVILEKSLHNSARIINISRAMS